MISLSYKHGYIENISIRYGFSTQGQIKEEQILQKQRVQLPGCLVEVQQDTDHHLLGITGLQVGILCVYIILWHIKFWYEILSNPF